MHLVEKRDEGESYGLDSLKRLLAVTDTERCGYDPTNP